jgi:Tfp pilus assembly protein PilX
MKESRPSSRSRGGIMLFILLLFVAVLALLGTYVAEELVDRIKKLEERVATLDAKRP